MTLEQRITILEKRLDGYIGSQNIKAKYDSYDKDGLRHTDGVLSEKTDTLADEVTTSEDALDTLSTEIIPTHDEAISSLEDAMDDLLENVIPSLMGNE